MKYVMVSDVDRVMASAMAATLAASTLAVDAAPTNEGVRLSLSLSYTDEPLRRAARELAESGRAVVFDVAEPPEGE